ncbi:MAG: type II toxin-antitoxin system RatA family toxin [Pseudomonadota bacterium]
MTELHPTTDPDFLHYSVDRDLPYACETLFDIAADVERYPEFLPGWKAVRTRRIDADEYLTDQMLAFGPIRERFTSQTHMERPTSIRVVSHSRTFRHFEVNWRFIPLADHACRVHLDARLAFKIRQMKLVVGNLLGRQLNDIMAAFERRAATLLAAQGVDPGAGLPLERQRRIGHRD